MPSVRMIKMEAPEGQVRVEVKKGQNMQEKNGGKGNFWVKNFEILNIPLFIYWHLEIHATENAIDS